MPRGDGVKVPNPPGPRRKRKKVNLPQYIPSKLRTRLTDDRPGEIKWVAMGKTYTPKANTEFRKPGSQNPRK